MEKDTATHLEKYDSSYLISKGVGVFDDVQYFSESYNGKCSLLLTQYTISP